MSRKALFAVAMCLQLSVASAFRPFSTTNFFGMARESLRQCKPDSVARAALNYRGGNNVQLINSLADFESLLQESSGKLVVVDFSASWCMPCKMIAPVFEAYSKEADFKNTAFVKVDVDDATEIAMKYGVQAMPTFLFIKDGSVVNRFSGADAAKLRQTILEQQ